MIELITKPDQNFAEFKPDPSVKELAGGGIVRIGFKNTIIDVEKYAEVLYTLYHEGKAIKKITEAELKRNEDGSLAHPKADLHWALAEAVHTAPRELLDKNLARDPSKVVRFSGTYGATGETLDRKIESDTGTKPEPGTGQKTLETLQAQQPVATAFQKSLESVPEDPGYYRAASGLIRHFHTHPEMVYGINSRMRKGMLSALAREMLNFPYQESVAATSSIATNKLLAFGRQHGLLGTPMIVLYDAVVTLCPVEERFIWELAHQLFMEHSVGWKYHGRILNYPIDTEMAYSWSHKLTSEEKAQLDDTDWACEPSWVNHKPIIKWLEDSIAFYIENPELAVINKNRDGADYL